MDGVVEGQEEDAGEDEQTKEQFQQRIRELEGTLVEHWEYTVKDEDNHVPTIRVPAKPTEQNGLNIR